MRLAPISNPRACGPVGDSGRLLRENSGWSV